MSKKERKVYRYSLAFKQKIVNEIEEKGCSINFIRKKYGIKGGSTIQYWIEKFGKNHLLHKVVRIEMRGEKDRLKELEKENQRLKAALADEHLEKICLETLVEVANRTYNTDLKKNFGNIASEKLKLK